MAAYVKVSIQGALVGGEVWSINPVFDPNGEFPGPVNQGNLDAATLAIANITPGTWLRNFMSSAASITGARVEVRDSANDALLAISVQGRTTVLSGTGTCLAPFQSAIVVSLRTNTPGGAGRGRLYWPCLAAGLLNTGRIAGGDVSVFLNDFKTYLMAINNALATSFVGIGFNPAVRSLSTKSTPHVVRIQAGDLIDSQRRRRDALREAYTTLALP